MIAKKLQPEDFFSKYGQGPRNMERAIRQEISYGNLLMNFHESTARLAQKLHFGFDPMFMLHARVPAEIARDLLVLTSRHVALTYELPISTKLRVEQNMVLHKIPNAGYPRGREPLKEDITSDRRPEDLLSMYSFARENVQTLVNRAVRNELVAGDNSLDSLRFGGEIIQATKNQPTRVIIHDMVQQIMPSLNAIAENLQTRVRYRYNLPLQKVSK